MDCCNKKNIKEENNKKGILRGVLYGLAPHTFCIAFILFSIIGVTTATTLLKPLLLNRYFFYILIVISFIFATVSAIIYLKRNESLSAKGIKNRWKYLSILYGTTILVNLLFFMVIFPVVANLNLSPASATANDQNIQLRSLTLEVDIPCSGHAPLITGELKKISGVEEIKFRFPNLFDIKYNPSETQEDKIISLEVFKTYKAKIVQ
jgi:ABC-type antimicrobial peptide transport system permease subunit